jgi:hypothetical protein
MCWVAHEAGPAAGEQSTGKPEHRPESRKSIRRTAVYSEVHHEAVTNTSEQHARQAERETA